MSGDCDAFSIYFGFGSKCSFFQVGENWISTPFVSVSYEQRGSIGLKINVDVTQPHSRLLIVYEFYETLFSIFIFQ
ncbi:hypothetical protein AGR3A_Cc190117 [Agrobacterium tomkonis CFBP 6623]|uniref:Uncharacterized protein n=1 Tax=Agrobacterium tomkonis CFBP 6623 TaxID=1183432 RepID=A0A1S7P2M3_9HYPH|nr:hypothetical protein AGR3A_Cc190117 [Agrobacterium tomkonis CFBP 6623]